MRSRPGLVGREVTTRKWRRDLAGQQLVSSLATCFLRRMGGTELLV